MDEAPVRGKYDRLALLGFETGVDESRLATFKVVRQIQYNRYFPVIFLPTSHSSLIVVKTVMLSLFILYNAYALTPRRRIIGTRQRVFVETRVNVQYPSLVVNESFVQSRVYLFRYVFIFS